MFEEKDQSEKEISEDSLIERFNELKKKHYKEQAVWFLNSYEDGKNSETCEYVWKMHKKCAELDEKMKEEGCSLDNEVLAHRVLEYAGAPATSADLRNFFLHIGSNHQQLENGHDHHHQDQEHTGHIITEISLLELLLYKFGASWKDITNAPPCYNAAKAEKAQNALIEAKKKLENAVKAERTSLSDAKLAQEAEDTAAREQNEASKAAELSRKKEATLSQTKEKAEAALKEVQAEDEKAKALLLNLESIASDDTKGIVARNKAKAEIAMIRNEDPLPLQKAKIHNEAAVRKLQKATASARDAAITAETARGKAEQSRLCAHEAKVKALDAAKKAEIAIPQAQAAFDELKEMVQELMKHQKLAHGSLFYIDREVKEAAKFLPKGKQKELEEAASNAKKDLTPKIENLNIL